MDAAPLKVVHLSDTHLMRAGELHNGLVDTRAALQRVLDRVSATREMDVVVASGDLSDDGSEDSYRALRDALDSWAAERGAAVAYVMGNHDARGGFEAVIGERTGLLEVRGYRLVRLDTSVPERGYGAIDDDQLEWLDGVLAEPAPNGTVLVMHHPPVDAPTPLLRSLRLAEPERLASVVAGRVRAILCGHFHAGIASSFAGAPVVVAPGVANVVDPLSSGGTERVLAGSGCALVEVPRAGSAEAVRATFVTAGGPGDGDELFTLDVERVRQLADEFGVPSSASRHLPS